MLLSERRRAVLSALVDEYVSSAHPVASRVLAERYELRVSPATVRSELAALEQSGHLYQPHVSAGRVPTDDGYRAYVDALLPQDTGTGSDEHSELLRLFVARESDAAEALRETAALLSRLTRYMSVVVAPAARQARVKRVSLISLADRQVLLVAVTDTGDVAKRLVELSVPVEERGIADIERFLNGAIGVVTGGVSGDVQRELLVVPEALRQIAAVLVDEVIACLLRPASDDRMVHGGAAGLLAQPEFADPRSARPLLELAEEGMALAGSLSQLTASGDTVVRIGRENGLAALSCASVVAVPFGPAASRGVVCLIGPTRMDYGKAITVSRCAAEALADTL